MRVILSVNALRGPLTGIGHYARNLAEALLNSSKIEELEGLIEDRILTQDELKELLSAKAGAEQQEKDKGTLKSRLIEWVRLIPGAHDLNLALRSARCRKSMASKQGFVFHETNYIPCASVLPTIITVHDLSYIHCPNFHTRERVIYLRRYLPRAIKAAAHVIVDAAFTRTALIEQFGLPEDRVTAIPLGVGTGYHPREEASCAPTLQSLGLGYRQFFLFVGTLEPRKNIERLLQAYAMLPKHVRQAYPLVLAGGKGWKDRAIWKRIEQMTKENQLVLTGYLSQQDLHRLYASAAVFIYPSLYEGFGLPVLEGMASGVPVITSNVTSMPEAAGDAALLVHPESVDEIAGAMLRIAQDATLAESLARRGLERARQFTWERCAEQTMEVYRRVGGRRKAFTLPVGWMSGA